MMGCREQSYSSVLLPPTESGRVRDYCGKGFIGMREGKGRSLCPSARLHGSDGGDLVDH
jgi:hypothetical protein